MPRPDFQLYLITDRRQTGVVLKQRFCNDCGVVGAGLKPAPTKEQIETRFLIESLECAFSGGARAVQVREKDLGGRELYELCGQVRGLAQKYGAKTLVNDRVDLALALELDGVHLGVDGFPVAEARKLLGPDRLIGASTHCLAEAEAAERNGADFITFGPVYLTASKARYGAPLGVAALREAVAAVELPVFAIGGVGIENLDEVRAAGAFGVAMISAILAARAPEAAARRILETWRGKSAGEGVCNTRP